MTRSYKLGFWEQEILHVYIIPKKNKLKKKQRNIKLNKGK